MKFCVCSWAVLLLTVAHAATESFTVDPARSLVAIHVGKAGVLSFAAGHTHEVAGPVDSGTLDLDADDPSHARIRLVIGTRTLKVAGKGEPPEDVPKVQQTMESEKVLDIERYPNITFQSTSVVVKHRTGGALDLLVAGQLTIRDETGPVSVPVRAELAGDLVTASGRFSVKQTAYGIKPVSVAGVVSVKDALDISFTIVARRR